MNIFDTLIPNITPKADIIPDLTNKSIDFSSIHGANSNSPESYRESYRDVNTGNDIGGQIAKVESGGDYRAENPHSSAVGKYQFLWNSWKNNISQVTGVNSKEEFRNNPQAQEKFFDWYKINQINPAVQVLQRYNNKGYSDTQLAKLFHFKGLGGARKYLSEGIDDTRANNISIGKYLQAEGGYIEKYDTGGGVDKPFDKFSNRNQSVWNKPAPEIKYDDNNYTPSSGVEYLKKALALGSISTSGNPLVSYLFDVAGATGDAYTSFMHKRAGDNNASAIDATEATIGFLPLPKAAKQIGGYKLSTLGKVVKNAKNVIDGANIVGY